MTDATVYVDVALNDDLTRDGYERELIRRIQEMRKKANLEVSDFIRVDAAINNQKIFDLLKISEKNIAAEVLAVVPDKGVLFSFHGPGEKIPSHNHIHDWEIEGVNETISVSIGISKVGE